MPKPDSATATENVAVMITDDAAAAPTVAPTPTPAATAQPVAPVAPADAPRRALADAVAGVLAAFAPHLTDVVLVSEPQPGLIAFNGPDMALAKTAMTLVLTGDTAHSWSYAGSGPDELNGRCVAYLRADAPPGD